MLRSLVCLALVLMGSAVFAQGTIKGNAFQSDSTSSLPAVTVHVKGTNLAGFANGSGAFQIDNVPAGSHTVVIKLMGYLTQVKEVNIAAGQTVKLNVFMVEDVNTLVPFTVMSGGTVGLKDIPGSIQYIGKKELEKFSYTDVNRTLRAVPGVNLQEEDGFGLRPNIGLRGTGAERSSKITVMEDGILMAPAPYSAPAAYYFPTIGRMQGIEILKGSSQIKYGPYTTGGAINLISTAIPESFGGRLHVLGGAFGARNVHAHIGNTQGQVGYMVETFQYSADGFKSLDGGGNTGFDKKDYLAKFRLTSKEGAKHFQALTLKAGLANETSNETYLGLTEEDFAASPYRRYAGSQKDQMNTEQWQFSVHHQFKFNQNTELVTSAYHSEFKRNWYKLDAVYDSTGSKAKIAALLDDPTGYNDAFSIVEGLTNSNDDALHVKANNRKYYAQGVQTELRSNFATGEITHNITTGLRYHTDQIDRFQWVDEYKMLDGNMMLTTAGRAGTESNRVETAFAFAGYLQYTLKVGSWSFTPGLRYENIMQERQDYGKNDPDRTGVDLSERSNTVDVVIPGMAADFKFSEFTSLFAGVHKGFSPPGSKDGTQPEASINYELGWRYAKNDLTAQLVGFYNDYTNLLGADLNAAGGGGTGDLFNGGEVTVAGLEAQATYYLFSKSLTKFSLPFSVVYTFTDATFDNSFESDFDGWGDVEAGDQLPYLANNQFTFILGLEHKKFSVNLSGRYMDEMRTNPGQGAILSNEKTDSYFVLDASATYRMHDMVSLFASATNLTDEVYVVARRPAGLRPGMPRGFTLGLKADF